MDGADIGVIECRCGLRFTLKAAERLRIVGDIVGEKLERDEAVQPGILSLVDDAHTAAAELLDDAIVGDRLADHADAVW